MRLRTFVFHWITLDIDRAKHTDSLNPVLLIKPPPVEYEYGEYKAEPGSGPEAYLKTLDRLIALADGREVQQTLEKVEEEAEEIVDEETRQLGQNWNKLVEKKQKSVTSRPGSVMERRSKSPEEEAQAAERSSIGRKKSVMKGLFVAQNLVTMFKDATASHDVAPATRVRRKSTSPI